MDPITHVALSSWIGEVPLFKLTGKKALIIGVVAQSLPEKTLLLFFGFLQPKIY